MSSDGPPAGSEDRTAGLEVAGVHVAFGDTRACAGVSLAVPPGEILALLGPSGCGKSTLLRVIAGLQPPDRGAVWWRGSDLAGVPPQRRRIGLMFQDHALFPHRDVGANVAFGLRMQGAGAERRQERVEEMLALVDLAGYERRPIDTLSGGEAQRVALARALAPEPEVLLLDEPLGSLDRALRDRLAVDLRRIIGELAITAVHVTHDHDEAFTVADRLAVMVAGRIEAIGDPSEVRARPGTVATARFLGLENVIPPGPAQALLAPGVGPTAADEALVVLPEAVDLLPAGQGVAAVVIGVAFRAGRFVVRCRVAGGVEVATDSRNRYAVGERVGMAIDPDGVATVRA